MTKTTKENIPAPAAPTGAGVQGIVQLNGVSKTYGTAVTALNGVTLSLNGGEVVGIAGPNGAGKSTLLSILGGFLAPTAGTVRVHGLEPRDYVRSRGIAYLPELVRLPPAWTVETALLRLGLLGGLDGAELGRRAAEAMAALGLEPHAATPAGKLSKGNLQRLGIAQMLMTDSGLIIFDEPSNGLDPVWMMRFRELVRGLRRPGRVIIVASHNLDELERLTDKVAILSKGRLERVVTQASSSSAEGPRMFRLKLLAPCAALKEIFPGALPVEGRQDEYRVELSVQVMNAGLLKLLTAGAVVLALKPDQSGLEREFSAAMEEKL